MTSIFFRIYFVLLILLCYHLIFLVGYAGYLFKVSFEKVASIANQSTKTIIVTSLNTIFIILVVGVLLLLLQPVLIFRIVIIVKVNFSSYLPCLLHNTKSCYFWNYIVLYMH